jgi:hypothetical protein
LIADEAMLLSSAWFANGWPAATSRPQFIKSPPNLQNNSVPSHTVTS